MTSLLDRLEGLGFVRRDPVAGDRRGFLVSITGEGTRMVGKVTAAMGEVVRSRAPTFASWSGPFTALGIDLGPFAGSPRDHEETLAVVARLARAGTTIQPLYRRAFGDGGPAAAHMMHALVLATETEGTRPTRISDATLLSSASTSDLLERMEQLQLVTRVSGRPPDRRVVMVTATKKGRRTLDVIIDGSDPVMHAIAEALFPLDAENVEASASSE
jgi:DNA-binding MarR family transcriptional regulator